LAPAGLWFEALKAVFLPSVPRRMWLIEARWWKDTCGAFETGNITESEVYAAAWQLMLDSVLYICEYYEPDVDHLRKRLAYKNGEVAEHTHAFADLRTLFSELADHTRDCDAAPLRIAHCIRDLAYGDESRAKDLLAMVESNDPAYREIFERCYWRPTARRRKREERDTQAERSRRDGPRQRRRKR
jgi:hypothetical protein